MGRDPADPRHRAEAALVLARRRNAAVVTLDVAGSPADSCATVVIPRSAITAVDARQVDPDSTQVITVDRGWSRS